MTTLLQQAIDLAQAGDRDAAEELLRRVLAEQPDNEIAWMWLSGVTRDVTVKQKALTRALELNPANQLAQKGLERFGGSPAPAPTEPAAPPEEPAPAPPPPVDISFDEPDTAPAPPIAAAPGPAEPSPATDLFGPDTEGEVPALAGGFDLDTPPVFDFDFDFDSAPPPILEEPEQGAPTTPSPFDFDLDTQQATPAPGEAEAGGIDWGEPPAFTFDAGDETKGADAFIPPIDSDSLEEILSHTDEPPVEEAGEPVPEPAILTEPVVELEIPESEPGEEELSEIERLARARRRQKAQTRLLIIGTALFTVMVVVCCGAYYYLTQVADLYTLIPALAGPELSVTAPKPKTEDGVTTLKFRGYPATKARIEWTQDDQAPTCTGTRGLEVNFNNGDPPTLINNRLCTDSGCSLEKNITPGPVSDVTVSYKCGKDATITLFK